MRIRIMGSGAAEGWPAVFCRCASCRRARELGGKNVRSRSGALIDDDLKIDLPPDTYMQALRDGLELGRVRHILITHTHHDHFFPGELSMYVKPFAHDPEELHVWGDQWVVEAIRNRVGSWNSEERLHELKAFEPVEIEGTRVLPLKAAHFPERGCFNYVIERGGKTLLYGMDSAWFPEESWEAQRSFRFDVVILDCTHGLRPESSVHGGAETLLRTKARMLEEGTATEQTLFVANHFSHNARVTHEELVEFFGPHGFEVAYDGMVIEV